MFTLNKTNKKTVAYITAAVVVVAAAAVTGVYLHSRATAPARTVSEVIVNVGSSNAAARSAGAKQTAGNTAAVNSSAGAGKTGTAAAASKNTAAAVQSRAKPGAKPVLSQADRDTSIIDKIINNKPDKIVYVKNGVKKTLAKKDIGYTRLYNLNKIRIMETMFYRTGAQVTSLPSSSSSSSSSSAAAGYTEFEYIYASPAAYTLHFPLTRDNAGDSFLELSSGNKEYPATEFKFDCPQILTKRLLSVVKALP